MNWLNLSIQILDSPEFVGSEPVDRATWLCLLRYCSGQENGGKIEECADWKDRKWQQLVRITHEEALRESELWSWDGDCLTVWGYPGEKEEEVRMRRENAKTNGAKGGRPRKQKENNQLETHEEPMLDISEKAEEKRREEKRREVPPYPQNGNGTSASWPAGQPTNGFPFPESSEPRPVAVMMARINLVRPEWARPAQWSHSEMRALQEGTAGQMEEMTDDDWRMVTAYMRADIPDAASYWRPRNRSKFVETFADVFQGATRWASKEGRGTAPKPVRALLPPGWK